MHKRIFTPGVIGGMRLKNRLVMAPMVRNWADPDGRANRRYEAHIARVASGGVGAIILEASYVSPEGKGFANQLGAHDDAIVEPLARLVAAARAHDARIGVQLYHAGRQTHAAVTGSQPVGPSELPCPLGQEPTRALTVAEIETIVRQFGEAARRCREAGCDFVEIHGAHGYLITQFLSPFSNLRTDAYGGSPERRFRFLGEVYAAVRAATHPDFPIIVRLSADEFVEGGLRVADTIDIARRLEALGAAAIHVSASNYASYAQGLLISPMSIPDAPLAPLAEHIRGAVRIPVIAADKIRTPELAERLIADGVCDFVALGRPLLADPYWPLKAADDGVDVDRCIACNEACIGRLFENRDVRCLANPSAGREDEFEGKDSVSSRRVVVVGGGPAGMAAAKCAAAEGHRVVLFERSDRLGGQLHAAAAAPLRPGWHELRRDLVKALEQTAVDVRLGVTATREIIEREEPDVVIVATGAAPKPASWPVSAGLQVLDGVTALVDRPGLAAPVVVAGGGCSGAQVAEAIAERSIPVTVVESTPDIARDAPLDERVRLLQRLTRAGVSLLTETSIRAAGPQGVTITGKDGDRVLPAGSLVLCHGSRPETSLAESLAGLSATVIPVGDCVSPRRVADAVLEGSLAALHLRPPDARGGPAIEDGPPIRLVSAGS